MPDWSRAGSRGQPGGWLQLVDGRMDLIEIPKGLVLGLGPGGAGRIGSAGFDRFDHDVSGRMLQAGELDEGHIVARCF